MTSRIFRNVSETGREHKRILYKVSKRVLPKTATHGTIWRRNPVPVVAVVSTGSTGLRGFSTWMTGSLSTSRSPFYRSESTRTRHVISDRTAGCSKRDESKSQPRTFGFFIGSLNTDPLNKALILLYLDPKQLQRFAAALGIPSNGRHQINRLKPG